MKNRIAAIFAASMLGLMFSATASFAADPTDAPVDVVVTDTPTDTAVDPGVTDPAVVDPAATDAVAIDDTSAGVPPEAMRGVTMAAPMAASEPAPAPGANVGTAAAITAFLVAALFFTRRRTN